ncbi:MAG: ATP-binding cassette domain-containing protein [Bacilli bacterium]
MNPVLETTLLTKEFHTGGEILCAVNSVTLHVNPGEFIAIMGPSGSGKSTLLHMLSGLEKATNRSIPDHCWPHRFQSFRK